jgi:hypothetical protein
MCKRIGIYTVLAVGLLASSAAYADMLAPTGDVTIYQDKPGDLPGRGNFGGLTADGLYVYDIAWGDPRSTQRTLMQFDVSAYGSGSVESAVLSLYIDAGDQSGHVLVYGMTHPWVEGTGTVGETTDGADWFTYNGASAWAAAGGDYDSGTLIADTVVLRDFPGRYSWDITSLVQSWVDGTASNYGLILVSGDPVDGDQSGMGGNASFYGIPSREASANQPYLDVMAVPEPCTMLLLGGGLLGIMGRNRRMK